MKFTDEYFTLITEAPDIEKKKLYMWIIWVGLATITFTKLTTGEFFNYEYSIILYIAFLFLIFIV